MKGVIRMDEYRYFTVAEHEKYKQIAEENGIKGYSLPLRMVCRSEEKMHIDFEELNKFWDLTREPNSKLF